MFLCIAEYNRSTFFPILDRWQAWWQINGTNQNSVIREDPSCESSQIPVRYFHRSFCEIKDGSINGHLKDDRVCFYQLSLYRPICPIPTYIMANWMVIGKATEEDAMLDYSCIASYESSNRAVEKTISLHLE